MASFKSLIFVSALAAATAVASQASAVPFTPVIDEFWIVKGESGGTPAEVFRDSFNDGNVPLSGPQDGLGGNLDTYVGSGIVGFTSETGGKLTMTPSLGDPTLITGYLADTFTGATKLRSTTPGNPNSLDLADSVEIHGLFDLSSLPDKSGQSFGIGFTDRATGLANEGDDTPRLFVTRSPINGNIGVRFAEFDFVANTNETVDFMSIETFLPSAAQIELVLTKAGGSNAIGAHFLLYDNSGLIYTSAAFDTINNVTGDPVTIYNGEAYTRAQFFSTDTGIPIPAPATLALFGAGLAALGVLRRPHRRR